MRQRAAESDVVIVNHHLLCADAAVRQSTYGEVIPDCQLRGGRRGAPARGRRHAVLRHRGQQLPRRRPGARRRARAEPWRRSTDRELRDAARGAHAASTITRARSSAAWPWRGTSRGGVGEERLRIGPDWFGDIVDDGPRRWSARSTGSRRVDARWPAPTPARGRQRRPTRTPPTLARRAGGAARRSALPARSVEPALRLLPRDARPRRVPARGADRRLGASSASSCCRPHARHRADVGDAHRRRLVRLRQGPPRRRRRRRACACRRSSTSPTGDPLPAAAHAAAEVAGVRRAPWRAKSSSC